jgi:hypothetical protein
VSDSKLQKCPQDTNLEWILLRISKKLYAGCLFFFVSFQLTSVFSPPIKSRILGPLVGLCFAAELLELQDSLPDLSFTAPDKHLTTLL